MKSIPADLAWLNLPNLPTPVKVLFSGYLLAIGLGLAMAGLQIMLTHGMADGKPGLSLNDIVYSYYCNRSGSKLERMLHGPMKHMGTPEARIDIIEWARRKQNGSRISRAFLMNIVCAAIALFPIFLTLQNMNLSKKWLK